MILNPIFFDIETLGLDPFEDEVIAIGVNGYVDCLGEKRKTEKDLINTFLDTLIEFEKTHGLVCIVGYNIISFDIPFITTRGLLNGVPEEKLVFFRKCFRVDLIRVVKQYLQTKSRYKKQKDVAKFFSLPFDEKNSGKDVPDLWKKGEFGKIKEHCQKDLEATTGLFYLLKGLCAHNVERRYSPYERILWRDLNDDSGNKKV